jgi:alpha-N-acetylglucosaminidase
MGRLGFQLDWLTLRGVNLLLAWVGAEKILVEVFQEIGLTESDIGSFLSGPAFQAWNRFGNIQGSWSPAISSLPTSWIESQLELQKEILVRMVEPG